MADAYNNTRPRYSQQLINRVVELAEIPAGANILEIGCGPGIATVPFAEFGFSMLCLEPSQEACQLARQNCVAYIKSVSIGIVNSSSLFTVHCQQSTVNRQHHSGVTGNDIIHL